MQGGVDPANGAHRVPDTDEMDGRYGACHCVAKLAGKIEISLNVGRRSGALDRHQHANSVWDQRLVPCADQSIPKDQRGNRTYSKGSAAEAEQINAVTGFVIFKKK